MLGDGWGTARASSGVVLLLCRADDQIRVSVQNERLYCEKADQALSEGVRLILRSKLGKMTVNEEGPEMLPAIA